MLSEELIKKHNPAKEELERLGEYAGMECVFDDSEIADEDIPLPTSTDNPTSDEICETMSKIVIMGEAEEFLSYIWENMDLLVSLGNLGTILKVKH